MLKDRPRTITPFTPEDVLAAVAEAGSAGRKLEVMGAGTKRALGVVEDADAVLSTARLDRIVDYQPGELIVRVQPGVRLDDLERLVAGRGQMLPFEPPRLTGLLAQGREPTIGGTIAANLSGPRRMRAGAARDHLLGFEAVSGRGERFKAGGHVVKNVTGYDLMKLMAGSWGTLAIFTELTLKVLPAPRRETSLLISGLADAVANEAMGRAASGPFEISGAAHLPAFAAGRLSTPSSRSVTVFRLEGFEASVAARADALASRLSDFGPVARLIESESQALWTDIREAAPFEGDSRPLWRLYLPPARGWRAPHALPGHALYDWAGGLVWLATDEPPEKVRRIVRDLGGHAMCLRGHPAFARAGGPLAALQDRIKAAFDPLGVLNPGRTP